MFSIGRLFFPLFLIATTVTCNNLIVKTESGRIRGVQQTTVLNNKKFIAYKGIPYAKPPVGNLRFKVQFKAQRSTFLFV